MTRMQVRTLELREAGFPVWAIAKRWGRAESSIYQRLQRARARQSRVRLKPPGAACVMLTMSRVGYRIR